MFGHWWSITQCSETTWDVFSISELQIDGSYQLGGMLNATPSMGSSNDHPLRNGMSESDIVRCGWGSRSKINPINVQCLMPALFNGSNPYCANLDSWVGRGQKGYVMWYVMIGDLSQGAFLPMTIRCKIGCHMRRSRSKINPINIQCLMPALFNGSDPYCANLE